MTCEVSYDLLGPEGAPVVVLSCSLGTDRSMWDPQLPALAERFRVVRYDLRGHGSSPAPPGPYDISDLGADLIALLDRLEIEQATLCGVSIGGMTSMWAAAHAPERASRLVLCCTSAKFAPEASEVYRERAKAVREHGVEPVADGALERWFTPRFRETRPDVIGPIRERFIKTSKEGYAGCCEALAALDLRHDLGAITAPTLVVAAADDPATPPDHGRVIVDGIPDARLEVVSDAAHLANIEKADEVNALMVGFIGPT